MNSLYKNSGIFLNPSLPSERGVGATSVDVQKCTIEQCVKDETCWSLFYQKDGDKPDGISLRGCVTKGSRVKNPDATGCEVDDTMINPELVYQKGKHCECSEDLCNGKFESPSGGKAGNGVQPIFPKSTLLITPAIIILNGLI